MSLGDDDDLVRIERLLTELARRVKRSASYPAGNLPNTAPPTAIAIEHPMLAFAQAWVFRNRARDRIFGADLFSDPAWNLLLHLYIGEKSDQPCSVSSLCLAVDLPQSTGLRWVIALERSGNVRRRTDPLDRRKTSVSLTAAAIERMEKALG